MKTGKSILSLAIDQSNHSTAGPAPKLIEHHLILLIINTICLVIFKSDPARYQSNLLLRAHVTPHVLSHGATRKFSESLTNRQVEW